MEDKCQRFINIAVERYGELYDYSKIREKFTSGNTVVKIKCNKHNIEFDQTMHDHAKRGRTGCKECSAEKRRANFADTTEQFIEKAKRKHPNVNYDYSRVIYKNIKTPVKIGCPEHGFCDQIPEDHLTSLTGCAKCSTQAAGMKRRMSYDKFIEISIIKHGDKYEYVKNTYEKLDINMIIICPFHGEFEQLPSSHIKGFGCFQCGAILRGKLKRITQDDFVKRAKQIHGDLYDYTNAIYIKNKIEVEIKCNICNKVFKQTPDSHINGKSGCPICKMSHGEKRVGIVLDELGVNYIMQKKFKECRDIKPMPFDFYIPDFDVIIEYDGIQHFKPIEKFGGIDELINTRRRDKLKDTYCDENHIDLIRVPYYEYNEIETIIKRRLDLYLAL